MATKREGVGCYDKAGEDEPIFVLRAQDTLAPDTVMAWVSWASKAGVPTPKLEEAVMCVHAMRKWQREHSAKVPD